MGIRKGGSLNVADAFECYGEPVTFLERYQIASIRYKGAYLVGRINEEQRFDIVRHACPGEGSCGGMFT